MYGATEAEGQEWAWGSTGGGGGRGGGGGGRGPATPAPRRVAITLAEPGDGQVGVSGGDLVDRAFGEGITLAGTGDVRPAGPTGPVDAPAAAPPAPAAAVGPAAGPAVA